ncbi:hypothetical protein [Dyadobacter frigoris]|uniref:Uncharacterized protein n=1 Tax=Dyadobacter frigoris TaxID=2576211 RepID=A0A4U6D1M2_9BACT|nr:hypothetical protein [Dyadobacter frigoris]TKT91130.1 hypothetical protein FDK13_15885 [Dyadobacter frigoris]GLU55057.1 hypothetical protein Dfri01_45180 [Dyadobacter frigoris]
MDEHIIPECFIDTKLIKGLNPPKTRYNHTKGCSSVTKKMREKFADTFALGIVDRDKRKLEYVDEFNLVIELPNNLQLFKHQRKNHYLIFICPAMEKWIISCADENNISLTNYNLPHDFKKLSKITKTSKSEDEDLHSVDFQKLFKEFKKLNSPTIAVLTFWIDYLKQHPFDAEIEFIKSKTKGYN